MLDIYENWPEYSAVFSTPKYLRLLRNSKYFSLDVPEGNKNQNILCCPTSKSIFSGTKKNIKKGVNFLLAYYVFWRFAGRQKLVIQ